MPSVHEALGLIPKAARGEKIEFSVPLAIFQPNSHMCLGLQYQTTQKTFSSSQTILLDSTALDSLENET